MHIDNYNNSFSSAGDSSDDNIAPRLVIPTIFFSTLASIFVAARIYGRWWILGSRAGWDDYCLIIAMLGGIGFTISACIATNAGLGRHYWDIEDPISAVSVSKSFFVLFLEPALANVLPRSEGNVHSRPQPGSRHAANRSAQVANIDISKPTSLL